MVAAAATVPSILVAAGASPLAFSGESCSERACVSATSWLWLDPHLPRSRKAKQVVHIAEEPGDGSKYNCARKNMREMPFFSAGTMSKKCVIYVILIALGILKICMDTYISRDL